MKSQKKRYVSFCPQFHSSLPDSARPDAMLNGIVSNQNLAFSGIKRLKIDQSMI